MPMHGLIPSAFITLPKKGGGLVLEGDVNDLVDRVICILKEKTAVLR